MTTPSEAGSPVDALADRFWEAILELNPTTATFYGDPRFADRLEDPGPEGRAKTRALMERTAGGRGDLDRRAPDRGADHPRHAPGHRRAQHGGGRPAPPRAPCRRPDGRPAAAPAADDPVPAGRHARGARGLHRAAACVPRVHGRELADPRRRHAVGPDRAADRDRTDHRPDRADAGGADRRGDHPRRWSKVASEADRERIREIVRDVVFPADTAFLDTLRGEYRHASREEPGIWSAPNGEQIYRTAIRSWTTLDLDPEEVHRTGLAGSSRSRPSAARSRERPATATTPSGTGRPSMPTRPTRRRRRRSSSSAPPRTSNARWPRRRATSASCHAPDARSGRSRSTRRRTRRSPTTTRRPSTAHARASTTPTATTSRAASTRSSRRPPTTRRRPGITSRSPSRWRTRTSTRSDDSGRGWSVAPMSRAGACTASVSPTRWGCSATRPSASACSTPRRGERPGSSSTRDCTRSAGSASARRLPPEDRPVRDGRCHRDRPLHLPAGQALTYKVGQREIERLRAELSARDGSSFDLRAFHDAVLGHGSLPLATLSRELPNWVATPA